MGPATPPSLALKTEEHMEKLTAGFDLHPMVTALEVEKHLLDPKTPVAGRMRAIFGLKGLNTASAIAALEKSLTTDESALVRHEVAYALGQMGASTSITTLSHVLADSNEDAMVRHEAAEAMGAIGDTKAIPILQRFENAADAPLEVRETCTLALARLTLLPGRASSGGFASVDPAPAATQNDVGKLRVVLCDAERPLFERYSAMFALRNCGGEAAVAALCQALQVEKESALFRHEVAYVLGQLRDGAAIGTLERVLADERESEMVRHEAAEALGSVGGERAEKVLERFRGDAAGVVRESVEVALDIAEYVGGEAMHYAETIKGGVVRG